MTQFSADEYLPQDPAQERVRKVLIVGGGSSGWMSAAMLSTAMSKDVSVELVESDAIGIIGVGEATIPPMQKFNRFVKLDEPSFLAKTQGTFKLGIEFRNWGRKGDSYFHQFGSVGREMDAVVKLHHWWMLGRTVGGDDYPQWQDMFVSPAAAAEDRFAFPGKNKNEIANRFAHAYHFDAYLYSKQLREICEARGVKRTEGRITGAQRDGESGFVKSVELEDGRRIEADLFIDCSGFRSLLLGSELDEPWDDWNNFIPSDRALAVPSERAEGSLKPYTQSIAHSVGWQWRIPLQHRTGNGHVFSSDFSSESEAEERLMATLDTKALDTPRLIKFRTGRRKRAWVNNVVGLGLSAGFLEPLESTSLHFVQSALQRLLEYFPTKAMDPALRRSFNTHTEQEWTDVRDFLVAHYHLTERDDSEFWRYTRNMEIPDSLKQTLEVWRARGVLDVFGGNLFQLGSWTSVMIGQRFMPGGVHALADRTSPENAAQEIRKVAAACRMVASRMPKHADFIEKYCPAEELDMAPA